MKARSPLLCLSLSLDVVGIWLAALLAAELLHHNPGLVLDAGALAFGLGVLVLAWFFGGYSFLRWPWMPFRQLAQRWLLVVGTALALAVQVGWLLNLSVTSVWFHRSALAVLGLVLGLWGVLIRRWLHPWARQQAALAVARSPVAQGKPRGDLAMAQASDKAQRQLLLLLVAYHPSPLEVEQLQLFLFFHLTLLAKLV